ncbi:hypothetical protein LTR70_004184 [Exophiala xenobiotica]|uniref:Uncharacterized protein n=1 Tax=Lithohypha guttulata TaxID=1690604 RepID=A0ABR0KF74_9EURO|nr:hypothetical protein LTR24_003666 [Lithohypha guttulata]KAK5321471.1 hypothetical protein LTR70_004184 [Exophiala xenobiotica]
MAATYAAYSRNGSASMNAQAEKSARSSVSSTASSTAAKKSRWQRFLNELKPIEEPQAPISIFGPGFYKSPKTNGQQKERQNSSRRASHLYSEFKTKVGGEKVNFYG